MMKQNYLHCFESYQVQILGVYFKYLLFDKEFAESIPELIDSFQKRFGQKLDKLNKEKYKVPDLALKHIMFFGIIIESFKDGALREIIYKVLIEYNNEVVEVKKALEKFRNNIAVGEYYYLENNLEPFELIDKLLPTLAEPDLLKKRNGSIFFERYIGKIFMDYLPVIKILPTRRKAAELSMDLFEMLDMKLRYSIDDWMRILRREIISMPELELHVPGDADKS